MSSIDRETFNDSIGDSNSQTLNVSASEADLVHVTLDDGTTDNTPSQYTITVRGFMPGDVNDEQFYWEETGRTDRSWTFEPLGSNLDGEITNTSDSSDTYRITVEARDGNE